MKYEFKITIFCQKMQGVVWKHVHFSFLFNSVTLLYPKTFKQKSSKNEQKLKQIVFLRSLLEEMIMKNDIFIF